MPKNSGRFRRKVPGAGKKKKPKVHGAPMSRIYRDQRLEEDAKAQMEAMKAIPPEERARVQEMTEAFLNTPLGAQDDSMNAYLLRKDPDEMMLNLGMTLSGDHEAINGGGGDGINLSLSSGGQPPAPPPMPPQALLRDGEEQATTAASGHVGPDFAAVPSGGTPPTTSSSSSTLPPRQAAGMYGSSSPPSPADLPPSLLSSMMAVNRGVEPAAVGRRGGRVSGAAAATAKDFTYLVRTLGAHGRFEEARARVMPEMIRRGIVPNDGTFTALLAGAAVDRNPDSAEEVWAEMSQSGVTPSAHAWSARIDAHARGGRMRRALKLGKEMREHGHPWDVATYTSLIAGSTRKRDYAGAWRLWKDMIIWGVQPDAMAYNTMIKLCAETNQYEKAMTFLDDMDMDDHRPSRITVESLIRAAATAPQWIRAYGTIVDDLVARFTGLGITPEVDTYRALMLAYSKGGDADKVLQCIEEAHVLGGHTGDTVGDGTPKLPWQAYCDALDAIARCTSVGRHRGTRARWGILPGQDALVMDISALEVPEEDFSRLRQMQMTTMEWDEDGEAALRKGFRKGKRTKFMGVTTPKDLIGDDEYERAIEDEYERVMQKAKAMKELERREDLMRLGIDPDARDRVAKTRPRVLPDPRDRERIEAPAPHWLDMQGSSVSDPLLPGDGPREQQPQQLGIGDGLEAGDGGWDNRERGFGGAGQESADYVDDEDDEEDDGDSWSKTPEKRRQGMEEQRSAEKESWSRSYPAAQMSLSETSVSSTAGKEGTAGGVFKRVTMFDLLEGDLARGREEEEEETADSSREEKRAGGGGGLVFPDNLGEMMEEVRMLAQQDLDRKKQRHAHLRDEGGDNESWDDDGDGDEEEDEDEDDWEYGGEEDFTPEGSFFEDHGEEDSTVALPSTDDGDPSDAVHDGNSLMDQLGQFQLQRQEEATQDNDDDDDDDDEYEDWTPLMHEGLKERTQALMGVVKLLEVDAMAAARAADVEKGFGVVGGAREKEGAGPAVRRTLRARLKALTESRQSKKAIKFVEEEYPKEGARVDVETALEVVKMYINTRGVGLAEAFEKKCREEHGLPPNRRILGAILNARARRGVAWTHEIPHVRRVLDTMQRHRIKPHENELRFVRQLVDRGKFNHSWLPVDPNANVKRMRLEVKKSRPVSKSYFKVVSKIKNAKFMQGTGRGKSRIE
eukprot:g20217.t1